MNEEEQRIAIAKAHGWTTKKLPNTWDTDLDVYWISPTGDPKAYKNDSLPDYPHDLNAIHAVLIVLTEPEQRICLGHIADIVGARENAYLAPSFAALRATAAEWCEAFLRAKGLWKE